MAIVSKYMFKNGALTTDSVGSNTLTATNTPVFSASSPTSSSVLFNGSNNAYTVPINFTKALVPTISFWIKQIGTTASQSYLGTRNTTGGDSDRGLMYDSNSTRLNIYTRYDNGGDSTNGYVRKIFPFNDGLWHYITINETSTGRNGMLDGKYSPENGIEYADARAFGNLTSWAIGARINNGTMERYANCQFADLEVHNSNLSIAQHKNKYAFYKGFF